MDNKSNVRPILEELRGYLSVAPDPGKSRDIYDAQIWNQYNSAIDELNTLTGVDYNKFKLQPQSEEINRSYFTLIKTQDYVGKLSGLINRINAEYFSDERNVTNSPNTTINTYQTQVQSQEQQQTMVVDMAMIIAEKKAGYPEGTSERSFLNKLGEALKGTKNISDIVKNIVEIGISCGLSLATIAKIFGI